MAQFLRAPQNAPEFAPDKVSNHIPQSTKARFKMGGMIFDQLVRDAH